MQWKSRVVQGVRLLVAPAVIVVAGACGTSIRPLRPGVAVVPVHRPAPVTPDGADTLGVGGARGDSDTTGLVADTAQGGDSATTLPSIIGQRRHPSQRQPQQPFTDQRVRVAIGVARPAAWLSATGAWGLYDATGEHLLARAAAGEVWTVRQEGDRLQVTSDGGGEAPAFTGPLLARPTDDDALLSYDGKHYRGDLLVLPARGGVTVVNRLSVEAYLRGVVPLEIGTERTADEAAAVEAQAIAARSYAYTRLDDSRSYDMTSTVMDQVYGGADAEHAVSDEAVMETRGMVLLYDGHVINAPYHANSGGVTAAASEVWRTRDEPYLISVSDRIPGTDHYYCEQSPKFRWARSYDADELADVLERYLHRYSDAPSGSVGRVHDLRETGHTPSGRVAGLVFETSRGEFTVRGNDIRFVLRSAGGDVLPSTLFTMDVEREHGRVVRLTLHGTGNGHGVGMDQWGAIARARAGQDYLTILHTYYPGTTIGPVSYASARP